jgi:hypothetical protein
MSCSERAASKTVWLDAVEAPDEATAIEKAATVKVPAKRLMALRR